MTELRRWRVVSTYTDGDRVLEGYVNGTAEDAETAAQRVREFRADQAEGPMVTVEPVAP